MICGPRAITVSLKEWVEDLESIYPVTKEILERLPALKILEMFKLLERNQSQGGQTFATSQPLRRSPTARALKAVRDEWIHNWATQWGTPKTKRNM